MPYAYLTLENVESIQPPPKGQVDYWDDWRSCRHGVRRLVLRVSYGGRKTWTIVYGLDNRVRRRKLGDNSSMKLDKAREIAKELLMEVDRGRDPAEARAKAKAEEEATKNAKETTFGDLAAEYLKYHAKPHKKSWRGDERMLEKDVLPHWKDVPLSQITRASVRNLVEPIAGRGAPIQANRVLALVRTMFNIGIERDMLEHDPSHKVRRPGKERRRDRVLNDDEIRSVWSTLEREERPIRDALRLLLMTAQRSGEVKQMRWEDVDLKAGWWTIPGSNAKNGLSHRVPLSPQAVTMLTELNTWYEQWIEKVNPGRVKKSMEQRKMSEWVFASPLVPGPMAWIQKAVERVRARCGVSFCAHDLRRTAATKMASGNVDRLVVSKILNHVEQDVTAIYERHGYDREKRRALNAWGRQLERIVTGKHAEKVVPFNDAESRCA